MRLARRDVVDIRHFFADIVDILERERTAGHFHRDGAARFVGIAFLRLLTARRFRVGAEVLGAVGRRRRGTRVEPWTAETSGPRTCEPAGPRTTGSAGTTGSRTKSAGTRPAGATIFARARLADGERTPIEDLPVELLNRLFGVAAILEFDERETTRTAGFTIDGQHDLRWRCNRTEVASQVGFCGAVGEVSNEQADGQAVLSVGKNLTRKGASLQAGEYS